MTREEILIEVDCGLSEFIPRASIYAWSRQVIAFGCVEVVAYTMFEGELYRCIVVLNSSILNDAPHIFARELHYRVLEMERMLNEKVLN